MSNLVLDSLEIKNFRAFKHLRIEKLGRVNLIVGKNNVGKSSVLDALTLYASRGEPYIIFGLMRERNEIPSEDVEIRHFRRSVADAQERVAPLRYLFHKWPALDSQIEPAEIRPANGRGDSIFISIRFPSAPNYLIKNGEATFIDDKEISNQSGLAPAIHVEISDTYVFEFPLDQNYSSKLIQTGHGLEKDHFIYVGADGLDLHEIADFWDKIALYDIEKQILTMLNVIAPEVEDINLVGNEGLSGGRIPKIRLPGVSSPIPLRSLGEGMNRMFGIALALVNAKDGMLLIDEIDTGLHYSVLPDLWKLIFEVAHRLNVQVFATSHSWDCIQAFQQAAADNEKEEGVLIRLENRKEGVGAVIFDEQDLAIVTREQIEVR